MAEKKKAYKRFEELTKQAMAPAAEAGHAPGTGTESLQAEALSIRLSPEVRQALEERAVADNTTPSEIVQAALRRYLQLP